MKDEDRTKKQLLDELRALRERVAELERQRTEIEKLAATGRMAAHVAHEINNPLAGIRNSFLLIKDAVPPDHQYYPYVDRIDREIDRISHIVRQIYSLYRPNQQVTRDLPIDVIIRDVLALLEGTCRERGASIELHVKDPPILATLPEGLIRQALFNIIQNAIEASPRDGAVKIIAEVAEDALSIAVSDQGQGIPEEVRPHIFEPFFTTKTDFPNGGLGLGLSIAKSSVESMKGTLEFESKPNQGTVFHIKLPLLEAGKGTRNVRFGSDPDRR